MEKIIKVAEITNLYGEYKEQLCEALENAGFMMVEYADPSYSDYLDITIKKQQITKEETK